MVRKSPLIWASVVLILLSLAWSPYHADSPVAAGARYWEQPSAEALETEPASVGYFVPDREGRTFRTLNLSLSATLDRTGIAYSLPTGQVSCRFVAAAATDPVGEAAVPARLNAYKGKGTATWQTDVPLYSRVRYANLYPGVDLIYGLPNGTVKSEFVLQPGTGVDSIRIHCPGVRLSLATGGKELVLDVDSATQLREVLPIAYQQIGRDRRPVDVTFDILDPNTYSYAIAGKVDPAYPIVIDPVLLYGTRLGGAGNDEGWSIAVDGNGNTYISGVTTSQDFPVTNPDGGGSDKDIFVAKFDHAGGLAYATVIGGASGEEGNAIAVDDYGNAYVAGETFSRDFPLLNAWQPVFVGYEEAFLLKLGPDGKLSYATYIGGTRGDEVNDMVADAVGNVYLGGEVYSDDYPLLDPWSSATFGADEEDGFITIFNAAGEMVYSTLVSAPYRDQVFRIAVDASGYVYGTGMTSSPNFPTINALQTEYGGDWDDCFVFKLDPWNNEMIYSTLLGGDGRDECWGIAIDESGAAYVTGFTSSEDFPLVDPLQSSMAGWDDVFVAKISPTGDSLLFSTYIGGVARDRGWDLALDGGGNVYIVGETESADFPSALALQSAYRGQMDGFLLVLDPQHTLRYSSYIGGDDYDRAYGLALDKDWVVHVVGGTASDSITGSGNDVPLSGGTDAFVTRYGLIPTPTPTPTPIPQTSVTVGSNGGTLWLEYPGHVTVLTVPGGYLSDQAVFTLTYKGLNNHQGELTGLNHFFALDTDLVPEPEVSALLPGPLEVTLAYAPSAVIEDTITLHALQAGAWTTDSIAVLSKQVQYVRVEVDRTGIYGLLGESNRLYLPSLMRQ